MVFRKIVFCFLFIFLMGVVNATDYIDIENITINGVEIGEEVVNLTSGERIEIDVDFTSNITDLEVFIHSEVRLENFEIWTTTKTFLVEKGEKIRKTFTLEVPQVLDYESIGEIEIEFEGEVINDEEFNIGILVLTENPITLSDYGVDTNENNLYNYLTIEFALWINDEGTYYADAELEDSSGGRIDLVGDEEFYLEPGENIIRFNFSGVNIYGNRVDGNYILRELEIDGPNFQMWVEDYITSFYNYKDFEKPGLEITGNFNDYGVYTNDNGLYDFLRIEVPIQVNTQGNYYIEAQLDLGPPYRDIEKEIYLETEDEFLYFDFEGFEIYKRGLNGPYEFENLVIEYNNTKIYQMGESYKTFAYSYENFENEAMPLLDVEIINPKHGSIVKGDFVSLFLETNRDAICKFNLEKIVDKELVQIFPYTQMNVTGEDIHIDSIEDIDENIDYVVNVKCIGDFDNSARGFSMFSIDLTELKEMMILGDIIDYEYDKSFMIEDLEDEISRMYFSYYDVKDENIYAANIMEFQNDSFMQEYLEGAVDAFNLSLQEFNGKNIYVSNREDLVYVLWIHENLIISAVVFSEEPNQPIPTQLVNAYLQKYPSDLETEDPPTTDTTPPTITLISPSDGDTRKTSSSSKTIVFRYRVEDESDIQDCDLVVEGNLEETSSSVQKGIDNIFSVKLARRSYDWQINCMDSVGNVGFSTTRDFRIKKRSSSSSSSSSSSIRTIDRSFEPIFSTSSLTDDAIEKSQPKVIKVNNFKEQEEKKKGFFERLADWFKGLFS